MLKINKNLYNYIIRIIIFDERFKVTMILIKLKDISKIEKIMIFFIDLFLKEDKLRNFGEKKRSVK